MNSQMVLLHYDQYQRFFKAQTVKMKDQKPVIKMVSAAKNKGADKPAHPRSHLRKPKVLIPLCSLRVRNKVDLVPLACEDGI